MEISEIIEALSRPEAYPHEFRDFQVHQTHISVVFLVGDYAYKVKKPVDLGFLDFRTLERRRHFCHEEVRLNRRLAPDVYLGVEPIVPTDGGVRLGAEGTAVEYAVKMRRLPGEATLLARLVRGRLEEVQVVELARRIAAFHAAAASGPEIARQARFDVVAGNARENLEQALPHVGETISQPVHARLNDLLEGHLLRWRPLIERRAREGIPRDTHGDLHLDHVYVFPDRSPPGDMVVVDCIEFNERFRFADPVADAAFLVMDLTFHRRRDLAAAFADAYFEAAEDAQGGALLPFYVAYRAAVRGKVEGMLTREREVREEDRRVAVERARAHWLLALTALEEPARRPCLILAGGLPGTGKTTLAEGLARRAGLEVLASDRVRKELAGLSPETPAPAPFGEGIYTKEWTRRTYAELLRRTERLLFEGRRVVLDASFQEEEWRHAFLERAERLGVSALLFLCEAPAELARRRLAGRSAGPSDANWSIYKALSEGWEPCSESTAQHLRRLRTDGPPGATLEGALAELRRADLLQDQSPDPSVDAPR